MVIDQRSQQVVGCSNRVEVTGEVQVDVFHGDDLRVTAAGRSTLDAEAGSEARLTQADHGLLADGIQTVAQAHRCGGLTLAGRRGVDGRHQHQLARLAGGQRLDRVQRQLGLVRAVLQQLVAADADLGRNVFDGTHLGFACDLDITQWHGLSLSGTKIWDPNHALKAALKPIQTSQNGFQAPGRTSKPRQGLPGAL